MHLKGLSAVLVLLFFVGIAAQDTFCALCLDKPFSQMWRFYDSRAAGRKVHIARVLEDYPCSDGDYRIYKCPTSCVHISLDYTDEKTQKPADTHMFECAYGIVYRLPGHDHEAYVKYTGEKTIVQQVTPDVKLTIEFFKAADSNKTLPEKLLSMVAAKQAKLPSYKIPVIGNVNKKKLDKGAVIFGVCLVCAVSFAFLYAYKYIEAKKKYGSLSRKDIDTVESGVENQEQEQEQEHVGNMSDSEYDDESIISQEVRAANTPNAMKSMFDSVENWFRRLPLLKKNTVEPEMPDFDAEDYAETVGDEDERSDDLELGTSNDQTDRVSDSSIATESEPVEESVKFSVLLEKEKESDKDDKLTDSSDGETKDTDTQ